MPSEADAQRIRELRARIKKLWIPYSRAGRVLETLERLLDQPRDHRMDNLLIHGVPGNGKTSIVKRFRREHAPKDGAAADAASIPVIYMIAPDSASDTRFYGELFAALYAPTKFAARPQMRSQAVALLKNVGARMLIVDEIQHVITGSVKRREEMLNALKTVSSLAEISIVGVGVEKAKYAIGLDYQLGSRFLEEALPAWSCDDEFRTLLNSYARHLGLQRQTRLDNPALAKRIHTMTNGLLGDVARLLSRAAEHAILSGNERITDATLDSIGWTSPKERIGRAVE